MKTIYLDLDGTILDVKRRLYAVYRDITVQLGGSVLPIATYWEHKRAGVRESVIAAHSLVSDISQYAVLRNERIESITYLRYDKVIPTVMDSLVALRKDNYLILTTLRIKRDNLDGQLRRLKISDLLDEVLSGVLGNHDTKYDLINRYTKFVNNSLIVGDTEGDIQAGKKLGIRTVSVLSGIRDRLTLAPYKPDLIIDDISQLADNIDNGCGVKA